MFHTLRNDNPGVRMEQRCDGDRQTRPGDVFHPSFRNDRPAFFDVTVRNTLQPAFLISGAEAAGVAAEAGVAAKDVAHAATVSASGGDFFPLVVESFGVWAPSSLETLRLISSRASTFSGLSSARALHHLLEQLSMALWKFNARLLRSHLDLLDDTEGWDLPA